MRGALRETGAHRDKRRRKITLDRRENRGEGGALHADIQKTYFIWSVYVTFAGA